MKPEEKAKELVDKYYNLESEGDKGGWMTKGDAKQCALIAVDFAIEAIKDCSVVAGYPLYEYQQVKEEINNL